MYSWLSSKEKKDDKPCIPTPDEMNSIINEHPTMVELITHPHRTLIIGRSRSGKTTLAVSFLASGYIDKFEVVYWFCSTIDDQDTYDCLREYIHEDMVWKDLNDAALQEMLDFHNEAERPKALMVIDDQSAQTSLNKGNKGIFAMIVTTAPWLNLSIMCLSHKVTSVSPVFRDNAEHVILLYLGNNAQKKRAVEEFNYFKHKNVFLDLYSEFVEKVEHGCIHIDTRPPMSIYPGCRIPQEFPNATDES